MPFKTVNQKPSNSKQTLWLSTMMVLSLLLIGYYTIGTPGSKLGSGNANYTASKDGKVTAGSGSSAAANAGAGKASDEYFMTLAVNATNKLAAEEQQLTAKITQTNDASAQSQLQKQLSDLQAFAQKQSSLEDQIVALGYKDAVVSGDPNQVDVVVQADKLDQKQALSIMSLIHQNVSGISYHNITVESHQ